MCRWHNRAVYLQTDGRNICYAAISGRVWIRSHQIEGLPLSISEESTSRTMVEEGDDAFTVHDLITCRQY